MPDVRDGTPEQEAKLNVLIEGTVNEWNKAPRRRVVRLRGPGTERIRFKKVSFFNVFRVLFLEYRAS